MTGKREQSGESLRSTQGFSLLEVMTVVAILGILATFAFPSMRRVLDRQEAKASATQVAGLLTDARTRAVTEGTPHLVYFNPPATAADGSCGAMAVEVRDVDHSYSITAGDESREFKLSSQACETVKPVGADPNATPEIAAVPMPADDLATRAPDAASIGIVPAVTGTVASAGETIVGGLTGGSGSSGSGSSGEGSSGESSSGSGSSGSGSGTSTGSTVASTTAQAVARSATISETAVNGATFPVDPNDGRPVVAFSERGIPVDPAHPTAWGSGAGGVYLTDGDSTVIAAVVQPLGEVQLRVFDPGSGTWK